MRALQTHEIDQFYGAKGPSEQALFSRVLNGLRGSYGFKRISGSPAVALMFFRHDPATGRTAAEHVWTVATVPALGSNPATLSFERKGRTLATDQEAEALRVRVALDFAAECDNASPADLSLALTSAMKGSTKDPGWAGLALRDAGGIYLVSAQTKRAVECFGAWVGDVSPSHVDVLDLADIGKNRATAARNAHEAFAAEIAAIKAELDEQKEARGALPGTKALNAKAARYAQLRGRIGMFADLLGDMASDLRARCSEAEAQLRADVEARLDARTAPAPAPEPAPKPRQRVKPQPQPEPAPAPVVAPKRQRSAPF